MKDNYDLKNPRPNPYAERMKNGYTIIIDRGTDDEGEYCKTKTENKQQLQTQRKS
jgi:SAM-dependent MidA family methyltransferase